MRDPQDKGFHPQGAFRVPLLGTLAPRSLWPKGRRASRFRTLGGALFCCRAESADPVKPFPLHFPGATISLGGVVISCSKNDQVNAYTFKGFLKENRNRGKGRWGWESQKAAVVWFISPFLQIPGLSQITGPFIPQRAMASSHPLAWMHSDENLITSWICSQC